MFGVRQAGRELTFRVDGVPGSNVTLHFGRQAVIQPIPGQQIGRLCSREKSLPFGKIPESGTGIVRLDVPDAAPAGFIYYVQAEVRSLGSATSVLTNCIPIVVQYRP